MTTRRDFLKVTTLGTGALVLGFVPRAEAQSPAFQPHVWLRIDRDGKVTIMAGKCEMGQGIRTSLPMIVAEELDADWSRVEVVTPSPSNDFKRLGTGGSWSIRGTWQQMRLAGASAREMLAIAAATTWGVERAAVRTEKGFAYHDATNRKLAYGALVDAASKVPLPQQPPLKPTTSFKLVGTRVPRVDGPQIVDGSAKYGIDVKVPGMLYATLVRPPKFGATLVSFDAAKAKAVAGVRDVKPLPGGVAVFATGSFAALKGREALKIEWKDGADATFDSASFKAHLLEKAKEPGVVMRKDGDGAIASDATKLEATYFFPFQAHAPLEPMNCTADVRDGKCTVWVSTQAPNDVQSGVAKLLGIDIGNVTVHVLLAGGGFGRRLAWDYALEAAEASRAIGAPVQLLWTRADDMRHGHYQAASVHVMTGAVADGKPVAWTHRKVAQVHNARERRATPEQMKDPVWLRGASWGVYDVPYAIPSIETTYVPVNSPVTIGPWRAVFSPPSTFARECFFDELAHAANRDPLDLRIELTRSEPAILEVGDLKVDRARLRRVLELVKEKSQWGRPLPANRGRGVAANVYDGEIHIAYVAEVEVRGTAWRVQRVVAAVDCGL
ncbi:MAG TPA: molybdopterin cofactor-binding domain-containing protein, partial [Thermoanaerobaculia bacterium]